MRIAALIVAAGRGTRAMPAPGDGPTQDGPKQDGPKQYAMLGDRSVLRRSLEPFLDLAGVVSVGAVIHAADRAAYEASVSDIGDRLAAPVLGGATRQESVRLGLESLAAIAPDIVLVHDAARPFVSRDVIARVVAALEHAPAAIAAVPLADTLKMETAGSGDEAGAPRIARTIARQGLWRAQTPQAFRYRDILALHRRAAAEGIVDMTDDAGLAEWGGLAVALAPGADENCKLTTAGDLRMAQHFMVETPGRDGPAFETRTGTGFDVHRFTDGDHVWLGGVKIPHECGLEGHSDADVALHALTDALLGCIGDGDIGQHFPPSDPKWKGAASRLFLEDAARRVRARGGRVINVDVTILAEAPRIGPHRPAMQEVIGAALGLAPDRIGVKATTTEGLGFTGRREGIAAMASASVLLPGNDSARGPGNGAI